MKRLAILLIVVASALPASAKQGYLNYGRQFPTQGVVCLGYLAAVDGVCQVPMTRG